MDLCKDHSKVKQAFIELCENGFADILINGAESNSTIFALGYAEKQKYICKEGYLKLCHGCTNSKVVKIFLSNDPVETLNIKVKHVRCQEVSI